VTVVSASFGFCSFESSSGNSAESVSQCALRWKHDMKLLRVLASMAFSQEDWTSSGVI